MHVSESPGQRKGCVGWQRSGSTVLGEGNFNKLEMDRRGEHLHTTAAAADTIVAVRWQDCTMHIDTHACHSGSSSIGINLNKVGHEYFIRVCRNISKVNSTPQGHHDNWCTAVANSGPVLLLLLLTSADRCQCLQASSHRRGSALLVLVARKCCQLIAPPIERRAYGATRKVMHNRCGVSRWHVNVQLDRSSGRAGADFN